MTFVPFLDVDRSSILWWPNGGPPGGLAGDPNPPLRPLPLLALKMSFNALNYTQCCVHALCLVRDFMTCMPNSPVLGTATLHVDQMSPAFAGLASRRHVSLRVSILSKNLILGQALGISRGEVISSSDHHCGLSTHDHRRHQILSLPC